MDVMHAPCAAPLGIYFGSTTPARRGGLRPDDPRPREPDPAQHAGGVLRPAANGAGRAAVVASPEQTCGARGMRRTAAEAMMRTLHVGLRAADLGRSLEFYEAL